MRIIRLLTVITTILASAVVIGASKIKVVILPIGANSEAKQEAAQDVERKMQSRIEKIEGVATDAFSKKERREIRECEGEVTCMYRIVKNGDADYYVIPIVAKYNEEDDEVTLEVSIYDEERPIVDAKKIGPMSPKKAANKLADLVEAFVTHIEKKKRKEKKEEYREEGYSVREGKTGKKKVKKPSEEEEVEEILSSASREEKEPSPRELMEKGYRSYREGDLDAAANYFEKAGKRDVTAKKIATAIREIVQKKGDVEAYVDQKRYDDAIRLIEEIEKRDLGIRTLGNKEGFFANVKRSRLLYEDPSMVDMKKVDAIHRNFAKRIEELRQAKAKKIAEIEKSLNEKIAAHEAKIKSFVNADKEQEQKEKEAEAALRKYVNDMKYKWEKEDGEIEQQIVALENKVTMIEQKEKGVIKVSTEKRDKEKAEELAAAEKKYHEERKKLDAEREAFLNKQKNEINKGSEKIEKMVADLSKQKKEKEEKVAEIEKKIQAALDEFDKTAKAKQSENETVKMKNEDEDRKFLVEVEKEYQKKFDELNQRLSEFDSKESLKKEDLAKFDKEIEEYMSKNAEEMGKIQEEIEKQRAEIEKTYNEKKAAAQTEFEAKYKAKIEELTAKKSDLEAKLAAWDADTEKMKQEKEAALTAENKAGEVKKELAKIDKDRKTEKAKIEKDLKKVVADLSAAQKGKEEAQAKAVAAVDAEFEQKFDELDMRLAKESERLNKLNNDFRKKKLDEKKQYEENFQKFLKDKNAYKKNIEKLSLKGTIPAAGLDLFCAVAGAWGRETYKSGVYLNNKKDVKYIGETVDVGYATGALRVSHQYAEIASKFWWGQNVDVFGYYGGALITEDVDATTKRVTGSQRALGWWTQLTMKPLKELALHVGYGAEDPDEKQKGASPTYYENDSLWVAAYYTLWERLVIGFSWTQIQTKDFKKSDGNRTSQTGNTLMGQVRLLF